MAPLFDRIVGVYHFLGDRIPRGIPSVEPKPRRSNRWLRNNQPVVAKTKAQTDIRLAVGQAIALMGDLQQVIGRGDRVLVKPNFNSPDPFPAATDLAFLEVVIKLILEAGAKITIGESSGGVWRPTRKVFEQLGVPQLARRLGVELIAFDDRPNDWVRIKISGDYLSEVIMPRSAYEADKMVYLPCMKTHSIGAFSGAIKLAFGFVAPGQRRSAHLGHLQEKVAEVNLCWQPDLIIMDGRKAFVSGGPDKGQLVEPGLLLASGDLIAVDVEAMRVLLDYGASNNIPANPWELPQIATAVKHGLGVGEGQYMVLE
ncbi:MAG: DUF362 domain-containing protein [Dehalococcoidia bacterium]|nr:MAG: DUF362 domain-containing protein [Dehalococcoidia bacterium]